MRIKYFSPLAIFALAMMVAVSGCDLLAGDAGRVTVKLKDAAFPYEFVSETNVTVTSINILGTNGTRNWLIADVRQPFNLLDLRDGKTATIVPDIEVPAGTYNRIQFRISPEASVVLSNGTSFDVNSGSESPVVVDIPEFKFDHSSDEAEILVDFNVDESFAAQGDVSSIDGIEGFVYSPVLSAESFRFNDEVIEIAAQ